MRPSIITLTTDFGLADHYVGVMKGVMASIYLQATFVDITHQVRPYCATQGAFFIAQSYRYFPAGTVHLVIVDPGVGSSRRPIAVEGGGHYFVAPDNGVLSQVLEREPKAQVREVDVARYALKPLSRTFHGRDIFASTSAWLAKGTPFAEIGEPVDDVIRLPSTAPTEMEPGHWLGRILNIDRFGNVVTSFAPKLLSARTDKFRLTVGKLEVGHFRGTYALSQGEEPFVMEGSAGYLEISINRHSAAARAGARIGDVVELWENVERPSPSADD